MSFLSDTVASTSGTWLSFQAWVELSVETEKEQPARLYQALTATKNEEDRQVVHHRMLHELFEERLFFPPIAYPRRVLDCGYGRGQWAVAMAQCYDQTEVSKLLLMYHSRDLVRRPASGGATRFVELFFSELIAS